jgi:carbon starvation protein
LVSSGTASKQIKNERDMLPVSFGSMLLESLLAVVAIIAVASFTTGAAAEAGYTTPPQIFAGGVASFLEKTGLPKNLTFTLINLAVSAFALTSLDSVARVGRLSFQEFFQGDKQTSASKVLANKYVATILTLLLAYLLAKAGYASIWPLFGSANQLLSVLALLACAVFFKKTKRMYFVTIVPAVAMTAVTFGALILKIYQLISGISAGTSTSVWGDTLQLVFAVLVFGLGLCITYNGVKALLHKK